jgi:lambda repressor-like predicted transcriptional regulator
MSSDRTKQRLTPDEFKAEVHRRGWTYRALAERWDVSENYVSKLARNADRSLHWDDAIRGLPTILIRKK